MSELLDLLSRARVYDLGQPYAPGMPHFPSHPPFQFSMTKMHGEYMRGTSSSAGEAFSLGGHVGTHIDSLCHFSDEGKVFGGVEVADKQDCLRGMAVHPVHEIPPIRRRGVLLDVAGAEGRDVLPLDYVADAERLARVADRQEVEIGDGDVVFVRTGWARYWDDAKAFIHNVEAPGPNLEGAQWLSAKGVYAVGSDTTTFEFVPSDSMPCHVHLLVEKGIYIVEMLDLEQLADDGVYEFTLIATPMKIKGGTGAPIRPLAFA